MLLITDTLGFLPDNPASYLVRDAAYGDFAAALKASPKWCLTNLATKDALEHHLGIQLPPAKEPPPLANYDVIIHLRPSSAHPTDPETWKFSALIVHKRR